jgi:hypothetical protein
MPSFLSKLFGGGSGDGSERSAPAARGKPVEYQGLHICAAPEPAGKQWRLAGVIVKESGDTTLERSFMRADTFSSREEAESFSIRKGQQIIDEQGSRLFASGEATGRV